MMLEVVEKYQDSNQKFDFMLEIEKTGQKWKLHVRISIEILTFDWDVDVCVVYFQFLLYVAFVWREIVNLGKNMLKFITKFWLSKKVRFWHLLKLKLEFEMHFDSSQSWSSDWVIPTLSPPLDKTIKSHIMEVIAYSPSIIFWWLFEQLPSH